ncbi:1954_t:CDS:2, partial [Racocetra fulgida]
MNSDYISYELSLCVIKAETGYAHVILPIVGVGPDCVSQGFNFLPIAALL